MDYDSTKYRTKNLIAKIPDKKDIPDLISLHLDPAVMKTLSVDGKPVVLSEQEAEESILKIQTHWNDYGFGLWFFRHQDDGRFIGRAGIQRYFLDEQWEVELAYAVCSQEWNNGFASEMTAISLEMGFSELKLSRIIAFTLPHNLASRQVMEKAKFQYQREFVHATLPHVLYELTNQEWEKRKEFKKGE